MNSKNIEIYQKRIPPLYVEITGNYTKQWSSWSNNITSIIETQVDSLLSDTEVIILFYYQQDCWTLFSENGIIWRESSSVFSLFNWQIADSSVNAYDNYQTEKIYTYIYLIDIEENIYRIPMESGTPCGSASGLFRRIPAFFPHDKRKLNVCRTLLREYMTREKKHWTDNWMSEHTK